MIEERPSFSIVVNTDGRRDSLEQTLQSFRYLDYDDFEVCVVHGPTDDGTRELLQTWTDRIKTRPCPARNLSQSRNIGIGLAAGEIVAFIDDDAQPEPDWLTRLAEAYVDPAVVAAGGYVYDPSGVTYQWRYGTVDRLGRADLSWERPTPEFNFPLSYNFPHLLGTNSSCRREAALAIGGFDEHFEYYLDETDFLCRLVDADGRIAQLAGGCVHHKFRPSHIRDQRKIVTNWYPILRSKIYFSLVNNHGHHSVNEAVADALTFIAGFGREVDHECASARMNEDDRARFRDHADRAWIDGFRLGSERSRGTRTRDDFRGWQTPFRSFQTLRPRERRRTFCFVSRDDRRDVGPGADTHILTFARAVSWEGHEVHVFAPGRSHATVDFEGGVWVHRVAVGPETSQTPVASVVADVRDEEANIAAAIQALARMRRIDAVFAPIVDRYDSTRLDQPDLRFVLRWYRAVLPVESVAEADGSARALGRVEQAFCERYDLILVDEHAGDPNTRDRLDTSSDQRRSLPLTLRGYGREGTGTSGGIPPDVPSHVLADPAEFEAFLLAIEAIDECRTRTSASGRR